MLVRVMGEMISIPYEGFNIQKMKFCFYINSFDYSYNFGEGDSSLSATKLYSLALPVNQVLQVVSFDRTLWSIIP